MRRNAAATIVSLLMACSTPPAAHKPLAQEPIGTGVVGGPSAALPTSAAAPSTPEPTASSAATSEPGAPASSAPGSPTTVGDLCPPKGQKPELSRLAAKSSCKAPKPRPKQLADLRSNEQLLASMQPNAPEREDMVFRLAQGYAILECSIATACAKGRDANATPDDIPLAEAKKRTDDFCSTLKSDFPKSKRHCP